MSNTKKAFGYLLVIVGVAIFIALFVSNRALNEAQIVAKYWYVLALGFVVTVTGAILTQV